MLMLCAQAIFAQVPESNTLGIGDETWVRTMTPAYDEANRDETCKVFSHLIGLNNETVLTKGSGGKYPHHRGLFIGWRETEVGEKTYDTWAMKNAHQTATGVLDAGLNMDGYEISWLGDDGMLILEENRMLRLVADAAGVRQVDFMSTLVARDKPVKLRGDLQHAGMQVRLANEISEHEDTTEYILPEGAKELDDDKVVGAWWVGVNVDIAGKRHGVMHMTPPTHPTGEPIYSIRRYARFGAFFEPDIEAGKGLNLLFRVAWTDHALDREACQKLYDAFAEGLK